MSKPLVSIVMGSDSDLEIMREAGKALEDFGIAYEMDVTSAHRSPDRTAEYAREGRRPRDSGDHRGSGRGGAPGGRDCGAYFLAGDRGAYSFDFLEWDRFAAGDGADAGRNSGGDGCDRQAGGNQRGDFGGADSGARERGVGQKDGGAQGKAGRRSGAEVAEAEGCARPGERKAGLAGSKVGSRRGTSEPEAGG